MDNVRRMQQLSYEGPAECLQKRRNDLLQLWESRAWRSSPPVLFRIVDELTQSLEARRLRLFAPKDDLQQLTQTEYVILRQVIFELLHHHVLVSHEVQCMILDFIDERKTAAVESEMRVAHRLKDEFEVLFELAGTGKAVVDPTTQKILRVNKTFCKMLGYTEEELLSTPLTQITFPDDREKQNEYFKTTLERRDQQWILEKRYVRKNGSIFWGAIYSSQLPGTSANPVRNISTIIDIDDRKRAELEIQRSYQNFKDLTNSLPQLFWWTDEGGTGNHFNKTWYEYTGLREDENPQESNSFFSVIHPEDQRANVEGRAEAMRLNKSVVYEERIRRHDGEYRWHLVHAKPVLNETGELVRWYASSVDIHDRKLMEQNLSRAIQSREELLAVVSHDLRNPLSAVLMSASTILRKVPAATEEHKLARTQAERIKSAGTRMNDLIEDLLNFAKIEAGRLQVEKIPLNLAEVMEETVSLLAPMAAEKNIELDTYTIDRALTVFGDRQQLARVISNLLGNALKFTPEFGAVTISLSRVDNMAQISVHDTGPGIAEHHLIHLFDRYWQAKSTAHKGTGLGLSIAKGIVEAHGGRIGVESKFGAGSTFHFEIPFAIDRSNG